MGQLNEAAVILALATAAMLSLGGLVKGVLGVGLPLVTVPLLSLVLPAPQAIGMLVVPVLLANLIQAVQGVRAVMHLAAILPPGSERSRERTMAINVAGTTHIIQAMEAHAREADLRAVAVLGGGHEAEALPRPLEREAVRDQVVHRFLKLSLGHQPVHHAGQLGAGAGGRMPGRDRPGRTRRQRLRLRSDLQARRTGQDLRRDDVGGKARAAR